jgi:hypothetical protein
VKRVNTLVVFDAFVVLVMLKIKDLIRNGNGADRDRIIGAPTPPRTMGR